MQTPLRFGIGGVDGSQDRYRPTALLGDPLGIEQRQGLFQAVTPARHLEHLDAQVIFQRLQPLPDGTSGDAQGLTKLDAGMKFSITQQFSATAFPDSVRLSSAPKTTPPPE